MAYCKPCQISYPNDKKFCKQCGQALTADPPSDDKRCPECGSELDHAAKFCKYCGAQLKIQGATPEIATPPSPAKTKPSLPPKDDVDTVTQVEQPKQPKAKKRRSSLVARIGIALVLIVGLYTGGVALLATYYRVSVVDALENVDVLAWMLDTMDGPGKVFSVMDRYPRYPERDPRLAKVPFFNFEFGLYDPDLERIKPIRIEKLPILPLLRSHPRYSVSVDHVERNAELRIAHLTIEPWQAGKTEHQVLMEKFGVRWLIRGMVLGNRQEMEAYKTGEELLDRLDQGADVSLFGRLVRLQQTPFREPEFLEGAKLRELTKDLHEWARQGHGLEVWDAKTTDSGALLLFTPWYGRTRSDRGFARVFVERQAGDWRITQVMLLRLKDL